MEEIAASEELARAFGDPITAQAAQLHIKSEYTRHVEPAVETLEQGLRRLNIATVWSSLSLRAAVPVILAEGADGLLPQSPTAQAITSGAGFAFALGHMIYDAGTSRRELRSKSPVSYMFSLKRHGWK